MTEEGFDLLDGEHAIVPVMFGDAVMAAKVADQMLQHGVFVTAFSFPVVPRGAARIRVQLSASHSADDVETCVRCVRRQPCRGSGLKEPARVCRARRRQICKDGAMAAHYDVLIVGGGIAGLSLASALAGSCSVALVEAEQELAYHTSSRSARQLIPSYGPAVVQELTVRTLELMAARDAELPEPVLSPRSFMLIGTEEAVPRGGQRPHAAHYPRRGAGAVPGAGARDPSRPPAWTQGPSAATRPLLLEDHRARAEAAGVDIITGARVHSAQRLGSGLGGRGRAGRPSRRVSWSTPPAPGRTNWP